MWWGLRGGGYPNARPPGLLAEGSELPGRGTHTGAQTRGTPKWRTGPPVIGRAMGGRAAAPAVGRLGQVQTHSRSVGGGAPQPPDRFLKRLFGPVAGLQRTLIGLQLKSQANRNQLQANRSQLQPPPPKPPPLWAPWAPPPRPPPPHPGGRGGSPAPGHPAPHSFWGGICKSCGKRSQVHI